MLDAETREGIRRSAERISSTLTDAERDKAAQRAHQLIDHLHETFPDDDTAANVAFMLAAIFATLNEMPVRYLNQTINSSIDCYTFAAGRLAGVYTLPEREGEQPAPEPAPSAGPSPYL